MKHSGNRLKYLSTKQVFGCIIDIIIINNIESQRLGLNYYSNPGASWHSPTQADSTAHTDSAALTPGRVGGRKKGHGEKA